MSQAQLPVFPTGATLINSNLAFERKDDVVVYSTGFQPIFMHTAGDVKSFRMITAQFCVTGNATQAEISRAFGVSLISVKRAVKLYGQKGVAGFFEKRKTRGASVLTPSVLSHAQELLNEGLTVGEVANRLTIKYDTLKKAIKAGRLQDIKKKIIQPPNPRPKVSEA